MIGGFTFCGYDIANIGLEYAPETENIYVYGPTETEVHSESFSGHHGGYFYGATKKPKEFTLRCFFEEKQIDQGIMTKIYGIFKVGKSGKLIFKRRPWCSYYATVTEVPKPEFTNYLNGTVTIKMTASYPFARMESVSRTEETEDAARLHCFYNGLAEPYHDSIMLNTGLFDKSAMVPPFNYTTSFYSAKAILLANPGTERAHVGIGVKGTVNSGLIIANNTTQQSCRIIGITQAITTNKNKELFIDGISGKTYLRSTGLTELAPIYHDQGFIELEPSYPILRNIFVSYEQDNNVINVVNIINEDVVGKYIFILNKWRKIVAQGDHTLTIGNPFLGTDMTITADGSEGTIITSMNEIYISPVSTMTINSLKFYYKPTFA